MKREIRDTGYASREAGYGSFSGDGGGIERDELQKEGPFHNRHTARRLAVSGCILIAGHDMLFNDFKVFHHGESFTTENHLGVMIKEGRKE